MASRFTKAGIKALAVTCENSSAERHNTLVDLSDGEQTFLVTVGLFKEGVYPYRARSASQTIATCSASPRHLKL